MTLTGTEWHHWVFTNFLGDHARLREGKVGFCEYFWKTLGGLIVLAAAAIACFTLATIMIVPPVVYFFTAVTGTFLAYFQPGAVFAILFLWAVIALLVVYVFPDDAEVYPKWWSEHWHIGAILDRTIFKPDTEEVIEAKRIAKEAKAEAKRIKRENNFLLVWYKAHKEKHCPIMKYE